MMKRSEPVTLTNMCMINKKDKILVLDRNDPVWPGLTFPGGHVEPHESFHDSVVREIKEETGLEPEFIKGFRYVDEYLLPHNNNIKKQVVYFLAEYSQQKLVPQAAEISQIELPPYNAAYKRLEFPGIRAVLQLAERYLQRKAPN